MDYAKFHMVVDIPKYKWETGYNLQNMFFGSCFTENIGSKMAALKYNVDINPFGILYNPASVASGLQILIQKKIFSKSDLVLHDGVWHSFYHHGRFSRESENETIELINSRIRSSSEYLRQTDFLFITFGTAWIFEWIKTGQAVSNCHKIPAREFTRRRLKVEEIVAEYKMLLDQLRSINPKVKVVFTVSPIRHWKDGAIENQRSKAVLLLAIGEIISHFGDGFCNYFPSYEMVMDELRDYRFYADDMLHISDFAVNYIWEKFSETMIGRESKNLALKVSKIVKAVEHKPSGLNSMEYNRFLSEMLRQAIHLEIESEGLSLEEEKRYFSIKLKESGFV